MAAFDGFRFQLPGRRVVGLGIFILYVGCLYLHSLRGCWTGKGPETIVVSFLFFVRFLTRCLFSDFYRGVRLMFVSSHCMTITKLIFLTQRITLIVVFVYHIMSSGESWRFGSTRFWK
jgi:hypothetical protein